MNQSSSDNKLSLNQPQIHATKIFRHMGMMLLIISSILLVAIYYIMRYINE